MKLATLQTALAALLLAPLSACVAEVDSLTDEDVMGSEATESADEIGTVEDPIIGGTVDKTTRSVVAVVAWSATQSYTCTGTIVAPHVVLTAAHCLEKAAADETLTVQVFMGDSLSSNWPWLYKSVKEFHMHPAYKPGMVTLGSDIGVVITKADLGRPAIAMNRTALGGGDVGTPIRYVGYGKSVANDENSVGTRRSAWLTLSTVLPGLVASQGGGKTFTCNGDSGGPGLVTIGGVPRIVGVNSYGAIGCNGTNWSTRVDKFAASFVDPYIAAFDPAFKPL